MTSDPAVPVPTPEPPAPGAAADLAQVVGVTLQRRVTARAQAETSLTRGLAKVGLYGWLVVIPTLAGLFLGRWLDQQVKGGITFTAALILAGVAVGFRLIWTRMHRE